MPSADSPGPGVGVYSLCWLLALLGIPGLLAMQLLNLALVFDDLDVIVLLENVDCGHLAVGIEKLHGLDEVVLLALALVLALGLGLVLSPLAFMDIDRDLTRFRVHGDDNGVLFEFALLFAFFAAVDG